MSRQAYLLEDRQERFNTKRAWFVKAWRVVDETGVDLVQPWCDTKAEARELAKRLGIVIAGDYPPPIHRTGGDS